MMLGEVESAIENVLKVLAAAGAVQYPDTEAMREALRHLGEELGQHEGRDLGDARHHRTLPCIPPATRRAKNAYFPHVRIRVVERRQGIGRVCVVDNDREILSGLHGFSATGYRRHTVERFSYRFHWDPKRACEKRRGKRVFQGELARQAHIQLFTLKRKVSAVLVGVMYSTEL